MRRPRPGSGGPRWLNPPGKNRAMLAAAGRLPFVRDGAYRRMYIYITPLPPSLPQKALEREKASCARPANAIARLIEMPST